MWRERVEQGIGVFTTSQQRRLYHSRATRRVNIWQMQKKNIVPRRDMNPEQPTLTVLVTSATLAPPSVLQSACVCACVRAHESVSYSLDPFHWSSLSIEIQNNHYFYWCLWQKHFQSSFFQSSNTHNKLNGRYLTFSILGNQHPAERKYLSYHLPKEIHFVLTMLKIEKLSLIQRFQVWNWDNIPIYPVLFTTAWQTFHNLPCLEIHWLPPGVCKLL